MKTRQICWENSINSKRLKPESDVLLADSNKQKLLLVKYGNKGKTESSTKSGNAVHTFAPEVKEITLLCRENTHASAKEPHKESTENKATCASSVGFENMAKCLYCNEKTQLGTDHNIWCRKLFSLSAMYTHYDLAWHSRWSPPKGFSGKKKNLHKRHRKQSAKGDKRDRPAEIKLESEPFTPGVTPQEIVPPGSQDGAEFKTGLYRDKGLNRNTGKQDYVLPSLIKSRSFKGPIPRSSPMPIIFSRGNSPDTLPQCVLCQVEVSVNVNRVNTSPASSESRNDRKCEKGYHDPKVDKEVNAISGDFKVPEKVFHPILPDYQRALSSPMTSPPPPTPETGTIWPVPPAQVGQSAVTETEKSEQTFKNRDIPESYMYLQHRWHLETTEHPTYGYGMFMPHPPLRRKEDLRTPSPGCKL